MAFYAPLFSTSPPGSDGTHPALQAQLRDGLRQAFPVQQSQESDERFQALLNALARRVPRTAASHARDAARG